MGHAPTETKSTPVSAIRPNRFQPNSSAGLGFLTDLRPEPPSSPQHRQGHVVEQDCNPPCIGGGPHLIQRIRLHLHLQAWNRRRARDTAAVTGSGRASESGKVVVAHVRNGHEADAVVKPPA